MMNKLAFPTWLERERENYFAQHKKATEDDFRAHVWELCKANQELMRQASDDYVTEILRQMKH